MYKQRKKVSCFWVKKMILPVHFCDSLSAFRLFVNQFLTYGEGVGLEGYKNMEMSMVWSFFLKKSQYKYINIPRLTCRLKNMENFIFFICTQIDTVP